MELTRSPDRAGAVTKQLGPREDERDARHSGGAVRHGEHSPRFPPEWEITGDYEYIPVRLPPDVTRMTASMRLSLEAEFGGWELSRVRLYPDGTRKVLLKRRRPSQGLVDEADGQG